MAGVAVACGAGPSAAPPDRIVLIVVDTLRRDFVGCYAGDARLADTPHMDALAARGQCLENAVSSFHMTTMSMGAMFTGRLPSIESDRRGKPLDWNSSHWCGLARFAQGPDTSCVPASLPTLGEVMREAGYETLAVQSNELLFRPDGFERGFDAWHEAGRDARHVLAGASELLERRTSDHFFLYVHLMDAHDYKINRQTYRHGVERADRAVGELLADLERRELLDGAVVVLTSDHGERNREKHPIPTGGGHRGNPSFEYLLRVPLIVAPARLEPAPGLLRSSDLFGQIAALAGAPQENAGKSALEGDELFLTEIEWQTLRKGRWKAFRKRTHKGVRLFDLETDPSETREVTSEHPWVAKELRLRMEALAGNLSTTPRRSQGLTELERERLKALGYLE